MTMIAAELRSEDGGDFARNRERFGKVTEPLQLAGQAKSVAQRSVTMSQTI